MTLLRFSGITMKFQPTRPLRGATKPFILLYHLAMISTHAPLAGRDPISTVANALGVISTHAPLAGRDGVCVIKPIQTRTHFNPRAPCGARRIIGDILPKVNRFQPTRPLRGATCDGWQNEKKVGISTHAPLAGRDEWVVTSSKQMYGISTHAPLAGRDYLGVISASVDDIFQPTRPLRGATETVSHRC